MNSPYSRDESQKEWITDIVKRKMAMAKLVARRKAPVQ